MSRLFTAPQLHTSQTNAEQSRFHMSLPFWLSPPTTPIGMHVLLVPSPLSERATQFLVICIFLSHVLFCTCFLCVCVSHASYACSMRIDVDRVHTLIFCLCVSHSSYTLVLLETDLFLMHSHTSGYMTLTSPVACRIVHTSLFYSCIRIRLYVQGLLQVVFFSSSVWY